jgi:hypothetical protein
LKFGKHISKLFSKTKKFGKCVPKYLFKGKNGRDNPLCVPHRIPDRD